MTILTKEQSDFAEKCMKGLHFVQWDRFIKFGEDGLEKLKIYGWIDREKDSYKDFIVLEIWLEELSGGYITSSDAYTAEIARILLGGMQAHHTCQRVEKMFRIENCVRLGG